MSTAWAQQDILFTQYKNNMLIINPAYAGSRDALTVNMQYRNQWGGIDGAPTTQSVSVHGPMASQKLGFGLSLTNDRIGPTRQTGLFGDLSGRIKVNAKSYLSAGLKVGFNFTSTDLTELTLAQSNDGSFAENNKQTLPNVGLGFYYHSPTFYAGFSVPKLIKNALHNNPSIDGDVTEKRHIFLSTGFVTEVSPLVKFKPEALARIVAGAPLSLDVTGTFLIDERVWLGGYYRLKESLGFILGYNFTPQFKLGYSYDFSTTELQNYNSGSHEISLTYDFIYQEKRIQSPRYF